MSDDATRRGGQRSEVAGTRVTEDELKKLRVVAGLHDTSVSKLLRVMSVEDALKEFRRRSA